MIRLNRDTLYSFNVANISAGATLTLPDPGGRYMCVMVINQDGYVNAVLHEPGDHELTVGRLDTSYVIVGVRILVDPDDPADVSQVTGLQDRFVLAAPSAAPFVMLDYDTGSQQSTRRALLTLSRGVPDFARAFGRRDEVDPVRFLLGTAAAYGGLPDSEASYHRVDPGLPVGAYELTVPADVPVDGLWSISLYDKDGYFPVASGGRVNLNSVTAERNADGSVTVRFGGDPGRPNQLPLVEGWNYMVRFYQPRAEILDGNWSFPSVTT